MVGSPGFQSGTKRVRFPHALPFYKKENAMKKIVTMLMMASFAALAACSDVNDTTSSEATSAPVDVELNDDGSIKVDTTESATETPN